MDKEKVLNLAKLARIEVTDEEAEALTQEFDSILKYVGEISEIGKLNKSDKLNKEEIRNVMREDASAHESGVYTEELLGAAPQREGGYVKVKKIL